MTRGILLVAIGKDYERLAACACRYGRKFTDLPVLVVTDVKASEACQAWENIKGVEFIRGLYTQKNNRVPKLRMPFYTPFDQTLNIDVDAVIQNPGVEAAFDLLAKHDIALNFFSTFDVKIPQIYLKAMKRFGVMPPLPVYNGGIICFKTSDAIKDLFTTWLKFCEEAGRGREMPALNCAIQKHPAVKIAKLPKGFFEPHGPNTAAVVQHNYSKDFRERFNLPEWQEYKPFDSDPNDFRWRDWK